MDGVNLSQDGEKHATLHKMVTEVSTEKKTKTTMKLSGRVTFEIELARSHQSALSKVESVEHLCLNGWIELAQGDELLCLKIFGANQKGILGGFRLCFRNVPVYVQSG